MEHLVFVYGTLKEGFCNFHINHGRRVPGEFVTAQPHALLIVGQHWLPWLLEEARGGGGGGHHVIGQVFAVDDAGLAEMDRLEQLDEAGWYERRRIQVRPRTTDANSTDTADAPPIETWVYFGSREGLSTRGKQLGPLEVYTLAHQDLLPRFQEGLQGT